MPFTCKNDTAKEHAALIAASPDWAILLSSVSELLSAHDLTDRVVFHGTSSQCIEAITEDGLRATNVEESYFQLNPDQDDPDFGPEGSYWGQLANAAWYAMDNVLERFAGGVPHLIVADVEELALKYPLHPDRCSMEAPVDPNTAINTPACRHHWETSGAAIDWRKGLTEIGAIFAVHRDYMEPDLFRVITKPTDFLEFLQSKGLMPGHVLAL